MKSIALIGQPNVGKSSLFNLIVKQKVAIVSDISGTTRDIRKKDIKILDKEAQLIDTGGIATAKKSKMSDSSNFEIFSQVSEKSIDMAKSCDIVLFITDGKKPLEENDRKLYFKLQKHNSNISLVVNKIDNDKELENVWQFYKFGIDEQNIFAVSVAHNRGTKKLFEWLYDKLPLTMSENFLSLDDDISIEDDIENISQTQIKENHLKVAIIGKVNVGKSSILNCITGVDRSIVSSIPGTTIDPVDEEITYDDKKITFVDTAGLRRRGKIGGIERYALFRTNDMLAQANLCLVVIDASSPISDQDEKIAGLVDKFALGVIIVLNKWDEKLGSYEKLVDEVRHRFRFLYYAPIVAVSAKTGRNMDKLKDTLIEIYDNFYRRYTTSMVNETICQATRRHSLPSPAGNMLKIYFSTQYKVAPPTFAVVMNKPQMLHFSYKRYLINFLRFRLQFDGCPIHIIARGKKDNIPTDDSYEAIYETI